MHIKALWDRGTAAIRAASWKQRLTYAAGALAGFFGLAVVLLLAYAALLVPATPTRAELQKAKVEKPAVVRSADGALLETFGRLNREWVALARITPHVIDALVATEDHRFYEHRGIDLRRTLSSTLQTLGGDRQGGSTITQQLARNLFPLEVGRDATVTRKIKEIITAFKIESVYTKDEILETYLNTVPFLYNAYGIEMAARTYFGKTAATLDVLESATLVGMLKGTSFYNPVQNPERAIARRNVVLGQMAARGKLGAERFEDLRQRPMRVRFERQIDTVGPAPHFAEHVRKWLAVWAQRKGYDIHADGLVVHTTLDTRAQSIAQKAVTRQLDALQAVADVEWGTRSEGLMSTEATDYVRQRARVEPFAHFWSTKGALADTFIRESAAWRAADKDGGTEAQRLARFRSDGAFMATLRAEKTRLQSGFMAVDPRNGHVKAWVGSRDFRQDQFDHVAQAKRQPGSTFKPFVYAAALQKGLTPESEFEDRIVEIRLANGKLWRPTDAGAPTGMRMTLRDALVQSKNTVTAQVMQQVGPEAVAALAHDMGIRDSELSPVPSLALGTSPVTLSEMVAGYATIANGGNYFEPLLVTRIEDANGNVIESFTSEAERALPKSTADTLLDMLRDAVDEGTGNSIRSRFGIQADVAGKTGTTQDNTDGWFMLMHPHLVAGAWVGFNDNRVTMRSDHWGRGASTALPVVGDFYKQAFATRLIDASAGRRKVRPLPEMREAREERGEPLHERIGSWFGRLFERSPRPRRMDGPREPSYRQEREPRDQRDDEVFRQRPQQR